jgi:hypothetical protein
MRFTTAALPAANRPESATAVVTVVEKEGARWRRWSSKPVWGPSGPWRVRLPPFSATSLAALGPWRFGCGQASGDGLTRHHSGRLPPFSATSLAALGLWRFGSGSIGGRSVHTLPPGGTVSPGLAAHELLAVTRISPLHVVRTALRLVRSSRPAIDHLLIRKHSSESSRRPSCTLPTPL